MLRSMSGQSYKDRKQKGIYKVPERLLGLYIMHLEAEDVTRKNPVQKKESSLSEMKHRRGILKISGLFLMPVQRVCRPDHTFRGFQGQIESGSISTGDEITALPSNEKAHVKGILVTDREVQTARKGQPVTISLDKEVDVNSGEHISSESLSKNGIAVCEIYQPVHRTYTVGDEIQLKGESYRYPESFDILILRDSVAVKVREGKITDILEFADYTYSELPVINGRGFEINVSSDKEIKTFLSEYDPDNSDYFKK